MASWKMKIAELAGRMVGIDSMMWMARYVNDAVLHGSQHLLRTRSQPDKFLSFSIRLFLNLLVSHKGFSCGPPRWPSLQFSWLHRRSLWNMLTWTRKKTATNQTYRRHHCCRSDGFNGPRSTKWQLNRPSDLIKPGIGLMPCLMYMVTKYSIWAFSMPILILVSSQEVKTLTRLVCVS